MSGPAARGDEDIQFDVRGATYIARLRFAGGNRLCMLLPGSGPQDPDVTIGANQFFRSIADGLAAEGVSSVRMGKVLVAGTVPLVFDYADEYVRPVMAMLAKLKARTLLSQQLVLVGHSLGGHVAPLVAEALSNVQGVALINAHHAPLTETLEAQFRHAALFQQPELTAIREALAAASEPTVPPKAHHLARYLWNAHRYSPDKHFMAWPLGALVLTCGADLHVPPAEADAWTAALRVAGVAVERLDFPGLNHLGIPAQDSTLLDVARAGRVDARLWTTLAEWALR